MDLLVYPDIKLRPAETGAEDLLSERGLGLLSGLHDWLCEDSESSFDVYGALPADEARRKRWLRFLSELQGRHPTNVYLLVSIETLDAQKLGALEKLGLHRLIVEVDPQLLSGDDDVVAPLVSYFVEHPESQLGFAFWMRQAGDRVNFRRLELLKQYGIEADIVSEPLFGPSLNGASQSPADELKRPPSDEVNCQIFSETLTIDQAGNVGFCPADDSGKDVLGNLFTHSPERIIARRGKFSALAGNSEMCVSCAYRGRFAWPKRQSPRTEKLYRAGQKWRGEAPWNPFHLSEIVQQDLCALSSEELDEQLAQFERRLLKWAGSIERARALESGAGPRVSIETPVFKGGWLLPAIESVLYQTSTRWTYYLVWDGGDELSHRILKILERLDHPMLRVFFSENRGISRSRHFLSEQASEDYILPLDDDDMFAPTTVERFLAVAESKPWAGIIRARRRFIDEHGNLIDSPEWFPFEERHYQHGMVTDVYNHCQPYLISRRAYDATLGWEGFPDFQFAGEDCDIFLKIEEVGSIELLDELLYFYRLNQQRHSHVLKPEGAYEMWRRLADMSIARIGLPLKRTNERQPFNYERLPVPCPTPEMVDFVIPFFESDEEELPYLHRRPTASFRSRFHTLDGRRPLERAFDSELFPCDRIELVCSSKKTVWGALRAELVQESDGKVIASGEVRLDDFCHHVKTVSVRLSRTAAETEGPIKLRLQFLPDRKNYHPMRVLTLEAEDASLIMRVFRTRAGYSRGLLDRCLNSLERCGIQQDAIHLVTRKASSAANRNEGFRRTSRPYVCFLDDDVEITAPNTFEKLLAVMDRTEADLIGPKLTTGDGRLFCADPCFNDLGRPVPRGLGETDGGRFDYTTECPWLPSTLFIIRREVFNAIGGFDEGYVGSQMEDVDFCLAARRRGFTCVYTGEVEVVHHNHQRNDCFSENFHRFQNRWKSYPHLLESAPERETNSV